MASREETAGTGTGAHFSMEDGDLLRVGTLLAHVLVLAVCSEQIVQTVRRILIGDHLPPHDTLLAHLRAISLRVMVLKVAALPCVWEINHIGIKHVLPAIDGRKRESDVIAIC